MISAPTWSDERVEQLKKLQEAGLSTSQIAAELGGGISRNAVIGKLHRLSITGQKRVPARSSPKPRSRADNRKANFARKPNREAARLSEEIPADFDPNNVSLYDSTIPVERRRSLLDLRDHHCRWPVGDPQSPSFFFCAGAVEEGQPYCAPHCRAAFTPAGQRAAERASMSTAQRAIRIAQGKARAERMRRQAAE